jgi:hypothetical protein
MLVGAVNNEVFFNARRKYTMTKRTRARTRLAILIIIVAQALGLRAGWPQQPADGEVVKQEKIYQSRGADVPRGYVTDRGLVHYAEVLPSGFCDALGNLSSSDRWLDIGAGEGQAILDYYALDDEARPAKKCARSIVKARAVAMSIEDRRTDNWRRLSAIFGADRLRYVSGKRLRFYSPEELGKFQIITDVYGGFSYTEDLSLFIEKTLGFLETGGVFYTMVQNVHLENGKDKPDTNYQTELVDAAGGDVRVCSWLKRAAGVKVRCESKSDWDSPIELIEIRKLSGDVSVPRLKLLKYEAGNPPKRRFQLEP